MFPKLFFCLLLLSCCTACRVDPSLFDIHNLNGNKVSAFGHAGMGLGFKYPINSHRSLDACLEIGAEGTETDVQLSKDGVLVLYHDRVLEAMTNMKGLVNDKTWPELGDGLYPSPYSDRIRLARADDLLQQMADGSRIFTFDCKLHPRAGLDYHVYMQQFATAIVQLAQKYRMGDRLFIESQDTVFLAMLQRADPSLHLFLYPADFEQGLIIASQMNLFGITISNNNITREQVQRAHDAGRRITVWDLKTNDDNFSAMEKSVDYMQTDRLIKLLKILGRYRK